MELAATSVAVRRAVTVAVLAAGAASLLAQVVLLREILASSQGNELVLGIVLALWLLLTGLASAVGGRVVRQPARAAQWLGRLLRMAPLLLLGSLWMTRWAGPDALGQIPTPIVLAATAMVALIPACFLGGLCFAWALAALADKKGAALLYGAETIGSAAGGLAFHFLLADRLSSVWIMFVAGTTCALASLFLVFGQKRIATVVALVVVGISAVLAPRLSLALASARFPGEQVLSLAPSRYGLLAVVERGGQRAFFRDGALLFTSEDDIAAEESIHLPLLLHPSPRRILLVGGGLGGGLVQALKHSPERLDYTEIDPGVFPLAEKFADLKTRAALADPRVHAVATDGRLLLHEAIGRYDVIIINLPIPQNALVARFLSRECFAEARRGLAPGGILALATPGSDAYLDAGARQRHASLVATLEAVFPAVAASPGAATLLWAAEKDVDARPGVLIPRLAERRLRLAQVGQTWLFDRLLPFHADDYRRALATALPIVNHDLRPVVYLFGLIENLQRISPALARVALALVRASWAPWFVAALVLGLAGLMVIARRGRPTPGFAVAAAGAAGMALQLVLLLAFQALRGHLYHALGGLLAGFMAGMAAGALLAGRFLDRPKVLAPKVLARACAGAAAAAALVPLAIELARAFPGWGTFIIVVATVVVGASTGAVYPVAVYVTADPNAASRLYAWDLAGAAGAAALASLLAIPLLGLVPVAMLSAALCAAAALANFRSI
jgi:spermidine synthase